MDRMALHGIFHPLHPCSLSLFSPFVEYRSLEFLFNFFLLFKINTVEAIVNADDLFSRAFLAREGFELDFPGFQDHPEGNRTGGIGRKVV